MVAHLYPERLVSAQYRATGSKWKPAKPPKMAPAAAGVCNAQPIRDAATESGWAAARRMLAPCWSGRSIFR